MKASKWATSPQSSTKDSAATAPSQNNTSAPVSHASQSEAPASHSQPAANSSSTSTVPEPQPSPAINISSAPPPPDTGYVDYGDEFAQTRGADDLFDDDFVPVAEPTIETAAPTPPAPSHAAPQSAPSGPRGRGRGQQQTTSVNNDENPSTSTNPAGATPGNARGRGAGTTTVVGAVRGDRSLTGPPKPKKLTEEELSAKMAAMKAKNATLEAAHAKAEADAAKFAQNEADAKRKAREERMNRQAMMGEREKNRERKLKAAGGREWDEGKEEEKASEPRRYDRDEGGRGFEGRGRGRGGLRGGRARGGERGRGRGGLNGGASRNTNEQPPQQSTPNVKAVQDFPDLPAAKSTNESVNGKAPEQVKLPLKKAAPPPLSTDDGKKDTNPLSPGEEKKGLSWADQVAALSPS